MSLLLEGPSSSGKALSPLEETHDQAEVEEGIKCKEKTVPQARPCIEGAEVQIVVITDATDHCRQQDRWMVRVRLGPETLGTISLP